MKTLYVRVVLTFLAVIVMSLLSSFLIGFVLFQKELNHLGQEDMMTAAETAMALYEQTHPQDLDAFMSKISQLSAYPMQVVSSSGELRTYGVTNGGEAPTIPSEPLRQVLGGEPYRSGVQGEDSLYVGVPFVFDGKRYALFVMTSSKNETAIIRLVMTVLILVLVTGSLCILVAARYLVNPLRALTEATKRLAQGDFAVELKLKRKDELGVLAQSFNDTARELKQLEQMRQDFVSNVSHEIQSPLTSISGFAKALKHEHLVAAEHRERYLDVIITESDRLSRLSENLLKLSSLESEQHPFESAAFNLDEQLRQIVLACEPLLSGKHIRIDLKLPRAARITADQDQLNQVWLNLIGNSIKFTPDGGKIRIDLAASGREWVVGVTDSGIGMQPEELSRIFERFYKADSSRSGSGNGLGLPIVKQIIHLHQGTIEVSSSPGEGTRVTVKLPMHPSSSV
ncbi:HAMP domain-containing sensor histidine kinase [Paenibacillus filicis]|uniref:Heme sensor protein HssS n=1 Tax=Paenibacillus filicis TaxID=669464 RepID=A0ABU9DC50_9BACL